MKQEVTIRDVYNLIQDFRQEIKGEYVEKTEFGARIAPLEKVVYGIVSLILISVTTALIATVVKANL